MFMNYHIDEEKIKKEEEERLKRIRKLNLPDWSVGYDAYRRLVLEENEE